MAWGIRYIVVALGEPNNKAQDEDVEAMEWILKQNCPGVVFTALSEGVSDRLTVHLLHERGAL